MLDVSHQLASQIRDRGEDAAGDHIALDLGEPEFDLVQPEGIRRCVVEVGPRMRRQDVRTFCVLCAESIVNDHMDRTATRLRVDDRREAGDELLARVPRHGAAEHFAAEHFAGVRAY